MAKKASFPKLLKFLNYVERINKKQTERSEIDLVSRLSAGLEELGLATVIDTVQKGARKRPDIWGTAPRLTPNWFCPLRSSLRQSNPRNWPAIRPSERPWAFGTWGEKRYPTCRRISDPESDSTPCQPH